MLVLRSRVFVSCWKVLSQKRCLPQYLSLLLSITHKRQAASDDYLKHRIFFSLSNLSMRDRQWQSALIGTKATKGGGEFSLPANVSFTGISQPAFSATASLAQVVT